MKLTNADLNEALAAMKHATSGGNRLPTLAALRASGIRDALAAAWKRCDEHRLQLCQDHGKLDEAGAQYVFETPAQAKAFSDGWGALLAAEREIETETLTLAEVESGWYRNPDTGKKEPGLDLSPDQLGVLVRLGIVTEAAA